MIKLNAKQLRTEDNRDLKSKIIKNDIYIILDNVLDTYNIGSVFRLAEAVAAKKVYLCEGCATPPNPKIKKASINTTEIVEWEYCSKAVDAIKEIRSEVPDIEIIAVEQAPNSKPFFKYNYKLPICLVVGHETEGVSKEVLDSVDTIVELPMYGANISLNVMVSLGIVLYTIVGQILDI